MAKADKSAKKAAEAEAAAATPAPEPVKRAPVDTRLKVLKKFRGRFLPKGPLRERLKGLMTRWDSGEDHGGVTFDELKALHNDWKAGREKGKKKPAQV